MVEVYSKPSCPQCELTYRVLDSQGIKFNVTDITEDAEAYSYITEELGYMQAPVVVTPDGEHWSGFQPEKIKAI